VSEAGIRAYDTKKGDYGLHQPWRNTFDIRDPLDAALRLFLSLSTSAPDVTEAGIPLNRVTKALTALQRGGNTSDVPGTVIGLIQKSPNFFAKFFEPFHGSSRITPLGAGAETAALRIGDRAVKFSPREGVWDKAHLWNPQREIEHVKSVSELPQVLKADRVMANDDVLVGTQEMGIPFRGIPPMAWPDRYRIPYERNLPNKKEAYQAAKDSAKWEFDNLWGQYGYKFTDPHFGNVAMPLPYRPKWEPSVLDWGSIAPK